MKHFFTILLISASALKVCAQDAKGFASQNSQPVGTIITSVLDYDNFTKITGDPKVIDPKRSLWIPADGRSIAGSLLSSLTGLTVAPDGRGRFLRGLNTMHAEGQVSLDPKNADEGDPHNIRKAGDPQGDEIRSHNHGENSPNSEHGNGSYTFADKTGYTNGTQRGWGATTDSTGGTETRPKNIAVYYYIKIN